MYLQCAIFTTYGGPLIADYSSRATGVTFSTNERGFASCSAFIPMELDEAVRLYDRVGLPHLSVRDSATGLAFEGRLEDVSLVEGGITLTAFGYARALSDLPYTAMWSVMSLSDYVPAWLISAAGGPTSNRKWEIDATNTQIVIGLVKNSIYAINERGDLRYQIPDSSSRNIVAVSFDYAFLASANVTLRVSSYAASATFPYYTFVANRVSVVGTGALLSGSVLVAATDQIIAFGLEATTAHTYAGETGAEYVTFSNVRVVSSLASSIGTTLTVARTNGAGVTCTVGSTANMYVGERLTFVGGGNSESVVALSIPSGTTFTANVVNAPGGGYPIGTTVQGLQVRADEIAKDLLTTTRAVNPSQLAATTALIQSPGIDLLDETYQDRYGADILDYLVGLGDNQTPPRQWEWGVYDGQALYFRPQSSVSRTWYTDAVSLGIDRTIDALHNSVYAIYQDANGRVLRSAAASDANSISRYALTRRQALSTNAANSTQAGVQTAAALNDGKNPRPRSAVTIAAMRDAYGTEWPLWFVRAGDTIIIRNVLPALSATIDRVRSFRLIRTEYHADDDTLATEPETPRTTLETLLARLAIGLTS